jgi:hypothetical protein
VTIVSPWLLAASEARIRLTPSLATRLLPPLLASGEEAPLAQVINAIATARREEAAALASLDGGGGGGGEASEAGDAADADSSESYPGVLGDGG